MQRRAFLGATGVGAVALAGCLDVLFGDDDEDSTDTPGAGGEGTPATGPSTPTDAEEPEVVRLRDRQFDPRNLSVDSGATVRWTNEDAVDHTITSASDNWSLDVGLRPARTYEHTFEDDGLYTAYCSIHGAADLSGMSMKIAVGDATIDDPLPDDDYPY